MRNSKGFVEIILVIVAVLAIAGVVTLWYFTQGNFNLPGNLEKQSGMMIDTTAPDYSSSSSADLETELDTIILDDPEADFKDIDSDLKEL